MSGDDYTYDVDYKAINHARIFQMVLASISLLFPLSVVIILIQRYGTLVRGRSLVHYVLMIATADTMTALVYAFGYPSGVECSIQSFCTIFFSRMSWFYTDVLIFQLFYVVVFKKYFLNKTYMDALVFTLNIVLSLLPLSTNTGYGQDDESRSLVLCAMSAGKGDDEAEDRWTEYTFELELYISFVIIVLFATIIACYSLIFNNNKSSNIYVNERIKDSWKIVILYPFAMMVTFLPSQTYAFYFDSYLSNHHERFPKHALVIGNYLNALNILYGPLLSIIFYTKTLDARRAWMHNLRGIMYVTMSIDIDDRTTCGSIISMDDVRVSEVDQSSLTRSTWSRVTSLASSLWRRDNNNNDENRAQQMVTMNQSMNPISNSNNTIIRIEENI